MNDTTIASTLKELGIKANLKGYMFLAKAIKLTLDRNGILPAVTKVVYPTVAKEFNTTAHRVERDMRHAIELAFSTTDIGALQKVFGNTIDATSGKATVSQFIATVAEYIMLEKAATL